MINLILKNKLHLLKEKIIIWYNSNFNAKKIPVLEGKKIAFIMLAATYNNLGDIAITVSQRKYLEKLLGKEYQIIQIPVEDTYKVYKDMKRKINNESIITLIGGGNNGSLYEFIEAPRRFILKKFSKNRIISFPQTVFYGEDEKSLLYKKIFKNVCSKCQKLTLIAREKKSYEVYRSFLPDYINIILAPDIVFSNDSYQINDWKNRDNNIMMILRKDIEKQISSEFENEMDKIINELNCKVLYRDTCSIDVNNNFYEVLQQYIEEMKKCRVIITDRLHGMIMAYITNTPCIVFDNNNHKIKETYETWLKNQNFVKLIDSDINEVTNNINQLINLKDIEKEDLNTKFLKIQNCILGDK